MGKSGPGMCFISSSSGMSGFSICAMAPEMTSRRLCGGMLVARPMAMPLAPLTSRLGKRLGSRSGSFWVSSKFRWKPTVSFSMSRSIWSARGVMRASVYRMAAGLSPSMEPKFPWPSTSGPRSEKGWAMRASAS